MKTPGAAVSNKIINTLNQILELELAGVVKYTHYSLMVFGYNRIPIVSWMKDNANEGLTHAQKAGELVTLLGGHPSHGPNGSLDGCLGPQARGVAEGSGRRLGPGRCAPGLDAALCPECPAFPRIAAAAPSGAATGLRGVSRFWQRLARLSEKR